jgi:hypothetical protein
MSLVIQCPHCKVKMSLGEGRVGEQIRCPSCRQQFTAEAKAGSGGRSKKSKATRRRSSGKGSQTGLAVLLSVCIGGTFLLFCTLVYLANRKQEPDPPRQAAGADAGRSRPLVEPKDTPQTPGTPSAGTDGKPNPATVDPAAFDATFAEVVGVIRRAEDEEPVKTNNALQALTADDRERAEFMMKEVTDSPSAVMPEHGPRLIKLGLTEWVRVTCAKHAREDADFRAVATAFAAAGLNTTELVGVMGRWYLVPESDRRTLVVAAQENWPAGRLSAEVRNAVLTLGGRKWLER